MHKLITSMLTIVAVAAWSPFAVAQSGDTMGAKKTYTGCVQAGDTAGSYMLAHALPEMGGDAMKKDSMQKEMKKDPMAKDAMASMSMTISSKDVDLSKHVGHKVTVTGTTAEMGMKKPDTMAKPDAMAKPGAMEKPMGTLTVTSLKMVAATCSM